MTSTAANVEFDLQHAVHKNRLVGLWRMATGYHWTYLAATLSLGVAATAKTSTYLLLSYFVDNFLIDRTTTLPLFVFALAFVGLAIVEGSCTFLSTTLAARTSEGITKRLRNYVFDHIQHLPFAYHDQTKTGELISRSTSDVDAVRRFFNDQAIGIGRIILLFIINFTAIYNLNPKLAFMSVIILPIIVVVSFFFFKRVSKIYEAYQEQEAILSTTLQENLTGVRVVKAFARQDYEIDKFQKANWEKFLRGKRLNIMHSLFWPVSDTICGLQILAGYFIGATMAINGEISIGTYLAYVGLIIWIIYPMRNLGRIIVQLSTGMVSFGRVLDIIKQRREDMDSGEPHLENSTGHVVFTRVGFEYEENSAILKDISFECHPGQVVALLGSTGSGKTTLVNLLPRFYDYTEGQILLDGMELKRYSKQYLRTQIGIVEQEPFLFSRSIRENILYGVGREVTQEEIEAAAKAAAIHDVILTFPEGYATLVGEKGVTLSGGQKQRVAIARTLLKNPRILILDDSTSSVDTETEAEIRQALQSLMQGRTSFVIAHRIQSIMNADLILVLENGRVIQRGIHEDLVSQPGMYRDIFEIQTRIETDLEKEIQSVS
ncbi:MAG TPA: ABC transporter ATP-binding protein [Anaerolineaceae bacterium]|nr:ABC transporter ATP-binding protein [Anaerolineaceae bacterium]